MSHAVVSGTARKIVAGFLELLFQSGDMLLLVAPGQATHSTVGDEVSIPDGAVPVS